MEVDLKPEVQAKLDEIARQGGQSCDEVVEDALIGYFDELAYLRETLLGEPEICTVGAMISQRPPS
jgi:hypothetical protein